MNKLAKYSIADLEELSEKCNQMKWYSTNSRYSESSIPLDNDYWRYKKARNIFSEEIARRTKEAVELIKEEIDQYKLYESTSTI